MEAVIKPPNKGLVRWVKRAWRQLKREQLTPGKFGVAVGMGLFFGLSPFWGLQMIAAQTLAVIFKLNKLAVAAAVSISAPPFLPFEVLISVQIGQRLLYGSWAPLTWEAMKASEAGVIAKHYGSAFAVGALVLAVLVAVPAGFFAAWRMRKAHANGKTELGLDALEALDDALPALPRRFRWYITWKIALDPIYGLVLPALVGRREVVDLGAGPGILAFFLKQASPVTRIRCVEWDAAKVELARALVPSVELTQADARTFELGTPDAIVMLDVLHYGPPLEQKDWLTRAVTALAPGGVLVLRELESNVSSATGIERQAVKGGWNKAEGVYLWSIDEMIVHLQSLGLTVTRTRGGRGLFKANSLLVATKPPAA